MNLPRFGVRNPVPINLMMAGLIIAGIFASFTLRRQFFPDMQFETVAISMAFPGASPQEVESAIAMRIENVLVEIDAIDQILTTCSEGSAVVTVKFKSGTTDINETIETIRQAVESLQDLPDDVKLPIIQRIEPMMPVIMVQIWGDADTHTMKKAIRDVRDDLRSFTEMGAIYVGGDVENELTVEIDQDRLVEHGISISSVADRISAWMKEIPGGTLRSSGGDIAVRTETPDTTSFDLKEIVIRSSHDGETLKLRDLGDVRSSVVDVPIESRFNGKPSMSLFITKSGDQDIVKIAEIVRAYVAGRMGESFEQNWKDRLASGNTIRQQAWQLGVDAGELPRGTSLSTFTDLARFVEGRLNLLTQNAMYGGVLVFILLLLALNWRVAFWVGAGLITALCGTLVIMSLLGITLNMLTMFGLILVLGLLVDDAIVVAENIKAKHEQGVPAMEAAVEGTNQVLWPVFATVLTSIVAFLPLTFIEGNIGDMLGALPIVIACALSMSLFEAMLILPGHLGHSLEKSDKPSNSTIGSLMRRYEVARDAILFTKVVPAYLWLLQATIRYRYISLTIAVSVLTVSVGMVAGGRVGYEFMTIPDAETIAINLRMPEGTPFVQTEKMIVRIEQAAKSQKEVGHINSDIGSQMQISEQPGGVASNLGQVWVELIPAETRSLSASEVIDNIRESVGEAAMLADRIEYQMMSGGPGGVDLTIRLRGDDPKLLAAASEVIRTDLRQYPAIHDIADNATAGQRELRIELREGATSTGLTLADLSRQVRGAIYGIDAHVFASGGEEVDIRVKLGKNVRQNIGSLEELWVVTPSGDSVPIVEIARISETRGYSSIRRIDRKRTVMVTAEIAEGVSPESISSALPFESWRAQFPTIEILAGGRQEDEADAFASLPYGFGAACLLIYIILAWLFRSYFQPLIVMLGIPFALIGVIWGHYIAGVSLSFLSMIGFVALSGVVVNDSLIFVEFYNGRRSAGDTLQDAIMRAGAARLRPIFLTTVTTVLGLTPLMLEQSMQAKFLIPMAIAISFGLMSATVLILLLLPALLVIGADCKSTMLYLWRGSTGVSL